VFVGLAVHTLIDGMALAASVQAEAAHGTGLGVYGVGTFLAILLHKPLDAVSITALMAAGGWSPRWRNVVNSGFALMCPLGAALLVLGAERLAEDSSLVVGCALAFSAGVFLCISLGDLLPEVEFHSHDRLKLSLTLLLGIALAWGIGLLEPSHVHGVRPELLTPAAAGVDSR
jgi:zinc and cadmium transporter